MLYSYTYFDDPVSKLHSDICELFKKLDNTKKDSFDKDLLSSELQKKLDSAKNFKILIE